MNSEISLVGNLQGKFVRQTHHPSRSAPHRLTADTAWRGHPPREANDSCLTASQRANAPTGIAAVLITS